MMAMHFVRSLSRCIFIVGLVFALWGCAGATKYEAIHMECGSQALVYLPDGTAKWVAKHPLWMNHCDSFRRVTLRRQDGVEIAIYGFLEKVNPTADYPNSFVLTDAIVLEGRTIVLEARTDFADRLPHMFETDLPCPCEVVIRRNRDHIDAYWVAAVLEGEGSTVVVQQIAPESRPLLVLEHPGKPGYSGVLALAQFNSEQPGATPSIRIGLNPYGDRVGPDGEVQVSPQGELAIVSLPTFLRACPTSQPSTAGTGAGDVP